MLWLPAGKMPSSSSIDLSDIIDLFVSSSGTNTPPVQHGYAKLAARLCGLRGRPARAAHVGWTPRGSETCKASGELNLGKLPALPQGSALLPSRQKTSLLPLHVGQCWLLKGAERDVKCTQETEKGVEPEPTTQGCTEACREGCRGRQGLGDLQHSAPSEEKG